MANNDPPNDVPIGEPGGGIEVTVGITQLQAFLSADDPDVREYAARTLAAEAAERPGDVAVTVPDLTERLEDQPAIRSHAATALSAVATHDPSAAKSAVPALTAQLEHSPSVRADAITALAAVADDEPAAVFRSANTIADYVTDEEPFVCDRATAALAAIASADVTVVTPVAAAVALATDHDDDDVRANATQILRDVAESNPTAITDCVPSLVTRLEDQPRVRTAAIAAIRSIGAAQPVALTDHVEAIAGRLEDSLETVREDASSTLSHIAAAEPATVCPVVESLRDALTDAPAIRQPSAAALRDVATFDAEAALPAVEALIDRLEDPLPAIRTDAAATLATIAAEKPSAVTAAMKPLAERLDDETADCGAFVAQAAAAVAPDHPTAVDPIVTDLATLLEDDDPDRLEAVRAIRSVSNADPGPIRAVVGPVASRLDDTDDEVRRAAADALGAVALDGPTDGPDVPALLDALEGGDEWVQGYAAGELAAVAQMRTAAPHPAVTALCNRLAAADVPTRRAASRDLVDVAAAQPEHIRKATPTIASRLEDEDASVRNNAALALARLAETFPDTVRAVLSSLFRATDDPDRTVRTNVIGVLETLGADHEGRSPAFELALSEVGHADPVRRGAAFEALAVVLPETGDELQRLINAIAVRSVDPSSSVAERIALVSTLETLITTPLETEKTVVDVVRHVFETAGDGANSTAETALVVSPVQESAEASASATMTPPVGLAHTIADVMCVSPALGQSGPLAELVVERLDAAGPRERRAHIRGLVGARQRLENAGGTPISALLLGHLENVDDADAMNALAAEIARLAILAPDDVNRSSDRLRNLLEHDNESVRGYAVLALGATVVLGEASPSVLGAAVDDVDNRLLDVTSIIVGGETPEHTDALNKQLSGLGRRLDDDDPWVGGLAALGLTTLADTADQLHPTAVSKLAAGLAADAAVVRATTSAALTRSVEADSTGYDRIVPTLLDGVEDPDELVREHCLRTLTTLSRVADFDALEAHTDRLERRLLELRADPVAPVRGQAARAYASLGRSAFHRNTTVSWLEAQCEDPVPTVSEAASSGVSALESVEQTPQDESAAVQDWKMERGTATGSGALPTGEPLIEGVDAQWRFESDSEVSSAPAVVGDTVYVGCTNGAVVAIALEDGGNRWQYQTEGTITTAPAVVEGIVYVGSEDGALYALDAETGDRSWRYETDGHVRGGPVIHGDTVYLTSDDGTIHAVDKTSGAPRFQRDEPGVPTTPAVSDGTLFVGTTDSVVRALSTDTGKERWTQSLEHPITTPVAVGSEVVLVGDRTGTVTALERDTGTQRWRFHTGQAIKTAPAVAHGTAFVASGDLSVYAIDLDTGGERFRFDTGGSMPTAPAVIGDCCCVGTDDGVVYGLDVGDGSARWRYDSDHGGSIHALAVADGLVCTVGPAGVTALGDERSSWADRIGFSGLFTRFGGRE